MRKLITICIAVISILLSGCATIGIKTLYNKEIQESIYEEQQLFENITYEELMIKIENQDIFMLYIGRDSCDYCKIFKPVLSQFITQYDFYVGEEAKVKVPLYYLDTQTYYDNIIDKQENAEEIWQELKQTLGIKYTPSLLIFKDELVYKNPNDIFTRTRTYGSQQFIKFIGSEYFNSTYEEKQELHNKCLEDLKADLDIIGDIVEKEYSITTSYINNETFINDNVKNYNEDCFTYNENWKKYISNKEYIDIVDNEYLENLEENLLKYSVSLSEILSQEEISYTIGDHGTGFIIDIDQEDLYIATNKHVVECDTGLGFETRFCYLWNQDNIPRYNNNYMGEYTYFWKPLKGVAHIIGVSDTYDLAILKFNFNENNFNGDERYLFNSVPQFDFVEPYIGENVFRWNTTKLRHEETDFYFDNFIITDLERSTNLGDHFIELDKIGIDGTSGSPFFNSRGELVGINVGSSKYHSYIIPSSIIIDEYEKIVGKPLYTKQTN